ncbi:hypothetical protein [Inquilinus limosus]|uniref:Uncharacterized protein n=1 Tax=Inquilinus limosus MP06 TaxID=1398085 RepID=A0A0A0DBT9_9PROT|nr:hypothetical protein [Inquilinus limosus]KGM36181.1 hypothetical protein P409_00605 [Inquilinus limosus MP06]
MFVVVQERPSNDMIAAGSEAEGYTSFDMFEDPLKRSWPAMVSASRRPCNGVYLVTDGRLHRPPWLVLVFYITRFALGCMCGASAMAAILWWSLQA